MVTRVCKVKETRLEKNPGFIAIFSRVHPDMWIAKQNSFETVCCFKAIGSWKESELLRQVEQMLERLIGWARDWSAFLIKRNRNQGRWDRGGQRKLARERSGFWILDFWAEMLMENSNRIHTQRRGDQRSVWWEVEEERKRGRVEEEDLEAEEEELINDRFDEVNWIGGGTEDRKKE